MNQHKFKSKR